jgi:hypothetical protein
MKSTPIVEIEKMRRTQALSERKDTKVLIQAENFFLYAKPHNEKKIQKSGNGRLKRSYFIHKANNIAKQTLRNPV